MNSFVLQKTASGHLTAVHQQHGTMVHSGQDPLIEADDIATLLKCENSDSVLLVGNGLGYLSRALIQRGVYCNAVEPFESLDRLRVETTSGSPGCCVQSAEALRAIVLGMPNTVRIVIAPYVVALRDALPLDLAECIGEMQVTLQSQRVYKTQIDENILSNQRHLPGLKTINFDTTECSKIAIAVGSGPTLSASIHTLTDLRESFLLVASSGAVPVLAQHNIAADWIVAMEARDTLSSDMEHALDQSNVLVFPWTHPAVLQEARFKCILAREEHGIMTGGGSTGLAAADFAAKLTSSAVFLVGMDMSDFGGEYSKGAARHTANLRLGGAKFRVMRAAASAWGHRIAPRSVYHMTMPGDKVIQGLIPIYPIELATAVTREYNRSFVLDGILT